MQIREFFKGIFTTDFPFCFRPQKSVRVSLDLSKADYLQAGCPSRHQIIHQSTVGVTSPRKREHKNYSTG